jgi:hypothetical protein
VPARSRRGELRGALLLPLAAWALHQLRYELWFGAGAHHALRASGHAYMTGLEPLLVGLAAAIGGVLVARLGRAWTTAAAPIHRRRSLARVVLTTTLALLVVFGLQETLEGAFAAGHPAGAAALLADGGWIAAPLALLLGAAVALLVRGGEAAVRLAARAGAAWRERRREPASGPTGRLRPRATRTRVPPLARAAAGRAPPRRALPHPTG